MTSKRHDTLHGFTVVRMLATSEPVPAMGGMYTSGAYVAHIGGPATIGQRLFADQRHRGQTGVGKPGLTSPALPNATAANLNCFPAFVTDRYRP